MRIGLGIDVIQQTSKKESHGVEGYDGIETVMEQSNPGEDNSHHSGLKYFQRLKCNFWLLSRCAPADEELGMLVAPHSEEPGFSADEASAHVIQPFDLKYSVPGPSTSHVPPNKVQHNGIPRTTWDVDLEVPPTYHTDLEAEEVAPLRPTLQSKKHAYKA